MIVFNVYVTRIVDFFFISNRFGVEYIQLRRKLDLKMRLVSVDFKLKKKIQRLLLCIISSNELHHNQKIIRKTILDRIFFLTY